MSKTFLQDVRVFAVNELIDRDNNGSTKIAAQTIGLLVKPEQVELITLAEEMGKIRLSMRSPNDDVKLTTEGAMKSNLLGDNRNGNSRTEESKPGSGSNNPLLNLLHGMKPPVGPQATTDEPPPFRMKIIRGPDVEEVELDPSGKLALNAGKSAKNSEGVPGSPQGSSEEPPQLSEQEEGVE